MVKVPVSSSILQRLSTLLLAPLRSLKLWPKREPGAHDLLRHAVALARAEAEAHPLPLPAGDAPFLSLVVPVYNTPTHYLDDLLASFRLQPEGLAELILSNDGSTKPETLAWLARHAQARGITVLHAPANGGIARATNAGIAAARGTWIALIDHDDAIAPHALERITRALLAHPQCRFLYTDEIIADGQLRPQGLFLKPAWDEVLLSGVNYINHFSVYHRARLQALGGLREGFEGSQDYDLVLRYTRDLQPAEILHLPYPAYLWRRDGNSYSVTFLERATANARRALGEHFARGGEPARIDPALTPDLHRLDLTPADGDWPLVSVVIPNRDAPALMEQVLDGLNHRTDYPNLEIIVVDNGSSDPRVLALYQRQEKGRIPFRLEMHTEAFNFSRSVNRGIALARGAHVLLLNNDIEMRTPGWLKEMVSCMGFARTGIVGAKLLYPSGTLQHAGVIAGLGGLAGHWFIGSPADCAGPMGRLRVRQSLSAVTGACMLISRACLDAVGRFDEEQFAVAYNDIDYCLRALSKDFRVIWTPFATLVHHESATRGSDETPANIARFRREQANLTARHGTDVLEDRAFNPWYTRGRAEPGLALRNALPPAR